MVEEVSKVDPTFAILYGYQNTLAIPILSQHGNEEQKRKYLPKLAGGMVN